MVCCLGCTVLTVPVVGLMGRADGAPAKVWLKLHKTDRSRFPILTGMASTSGKSRGWILVGMCLVPADNVCVLSRGGGVGGHAGEVP